MEDSEEQTKTRAVADIIKDCEKVADQLSKEADALLFGEIKSSWHEPMAMSRIIKECLSWADLVLEEDEVQANQRGLVLRLLNRYESSVRHDLRMLEWLRDQVVELMSGETDGK